MEQVGSRKEGIILRFIKNQRPQGSSKTPVGCFIVSFALWLNQGLVGAPECGDVMRLQIQVSDEGVIEDAKFKTFGCGSAIASSSLATEWLKGKSVDEALEIDNMEIVEELALPPVKIHCSVLAEDAIKAAINDYRVKKGLEPLEAEKSIH